MFAVFIAIIHHASWPMSVKPAPSTWDRLTCFLAWLTPAVMVVQDRPLVLQGAVRMHMMFSVSAIRDPPPAQKQRKMLKRVGAESK